jgi:hypothetical protein
MSPTFAVDADAGMNPNQGKRDEMDLRFIVGSRVTSAPIDLRRNSAGD